MPVQLCERVSDKLHETDKLCDPVQLLEPVALAEMLLELLREPLGAETDEEGEAEELGDADTDGLQERVYVVLELGLGPVTLGLQEVESEAELLVETEALRDPVAETEGEPVLLQDAVWETV